jgi:putative restriction endonuclease
LASCRSQVEPFEEIYLSQIDQHEQLDQPIIPNGLPLTKIHHAAFDANLIGIDADFRIHVADRLLEIHDGPFLELGLSRSTAR